MKIIKNLLLAFLIPFAVACGDDSDNRAQMGRWRAVQDGVERSNCDLESNNGPVNCPTTATSSCIELNLEANNFYGLNVAIGSTIDGGQSGTYELESNKIILCPIGGECYDVPVVDSGFDDLTIELNNETTGCRLRVEMKKL
ncbi:hypothetical protein N6H18_06195 [Reichenbachiella agarivorans]|uniref:Lipocalin-like domain-containing protein n=1 Tax=Reichenbachiella agarivorans TaxID=2979464 RepID=A0ABY6CSS5_9BACT|nr:hypothetical protein [Reichenbachiella agarivorans]UXP33543.1 hypothetical protein N6H18_06195 [Reichenbachiella agarivorans]